MPNPQREALIEILLIISSLIAQYRLHQITPARPGGPPISLVFQQPLIEEATLFWKMKSANRRSIRPLLITSFIVVVLVASGLLYVILEARNSSPNSSSQDQCGLFTTAMQTNFVENAESTNFVGLNESAPPWNYQSVYDHIQQGWQSICQSQEFSELVQAHGSGGFSASFGYTHNANQAASEVGIGLFWTQHPIFSGCTAYQASWSIFIVNGTASSATMMSSSCEKGP